MGISRITAPAPCPSPPSATKKNRKFEILFLKTFSLKRKTNRIVKVTIEKIKFVSSRKQSM